MTRLHRLTVAVGVLLSVVAAGAVHAAPPPALPRLESHVELRGSRPGSVDVVAAQPFSISPHWFDPPAELFSATRAGSGFALQRLTDEFPATFVGVAAPEAARKRSILFPFGNDGQGGDAFFSSHFPAGRYRLSLFTTGPTVVRFSLRTGGGRTLHASPGTPAEIPMQLLTAGGPSRVGSVLGAAKPQLPADRYTLLQTVAGRLNVSATGYESYWCQYHGGPPSLGYQPRCLGGSGTGVAMIGPLLNYDYSGFSAIMGIPGTGRDAFSRSLNGVGEIVDQTSLFIWIPLPNPPSSTTTGESRSLLSGDNVSGVRRHAA